MKFIFIFIALLSVSGCVSIEAPENLVSDTVEAGKNAYISIKNKMSQDEKSDKNHIFSYKHIIPSGELISDSNSNCLNGAIEQARKTLNIYMLEVEKTTSKSIIDEDKHVLECSIYVAKQ